MSKHSEEVQKFSMAIETFAITKNTSIMDSILHYCNSVGLEVEMVSKLISENLKEKLALEMKSLNLLKGQRNTPGLF